MASPTSRCAIAKRVTESIISITSRPWSRKCSAIVVALNAALMRTSPGWSGVATTTTERAMPGTGGTERRRAGAEPGERPAEAVDGADEQLVADVDPQGVPAGGDARA